MITVFWNVFEYTRELICIVCPGDQSDLALFLFNTEHAGYLRKYVCFVHWLSKMFVSLKQRKVTFFKTTN